jgi:hypothetical protein
VLLGLDGLMQALGIAAAQHDAAGELVDDEHLAVLDHVVDIALHDAVGLQGLVDVVGEGGVLYIGQVIHAEEFLGLGYSPGGEGGGTELFVHHIVGVQVLVLLLLVVGGGVDYLLEAGDEIVRLR